MKYYFLNKVAMAVLLALLLFFGTKTAVDIAFEQHPPETPGYEVAGIEDEAKGEAEAPADDGADFILALNQADPAKGEQDVALCKACHSFEKGGPNMLGPNLYGIMGYEIAGHEGVTYSAALKEKEGDWTFEDMDKWLENPQAFAAGTTMGFAGIPDVQKRANVIAYLNQNSDSPLPIPEPKAAAQEAAPEEAAAETEAAEEGAEDAGGEAAAGQSETLALLATADPAAGEQGAALCKACHTFDKGGPNMVGPNLYNTVGAPIPAHEGFGYSAALKDKGGEWTYEALDAWLENPMAFAPGTTMVFPGIKDPQKRAEMIAFLRSKTDNPPPLPEAAAAPADDAAPAEDASAKDASADDASADDASADDAAPADDAAGSEDATAQDDVAPAADDAGATEEPAAEEPAAEEPADEEPAPADTPEAANDKDAGATIVVPPTLAQDAPSEPNAGEPPSANQPQPVYPEQSADASGAASEAGDNEAENAIMAEAAESPAASTAEAAPNGWPQPAYPDGKPDGL